MKFDAKTKEGERIYCLDGEFELDYPHESKVQGSLGHTISMLDRSAVPERKNLGNV